METGEVLRGIDATAIEFSMKSVPVTREVLHDPIIRQRAIQIQLYALCHLKDENESR